MFRHTPIVITALIWLALPLSAVAAEKHRLILDWFPNGNHVPLFLARDGGHFTREGLDIELLAPADPNDPLKLVAAGQASFGLNYQPNVIVARAQGLPVRSVGVLLEHPVASLAFLKKSGIRTPADLRGRRIGYSVQDLELALLRTLAASAGVKPNEYETLNVNFNLTSSLLSGQVDAVMGAYWNYELAELELEGQEGGYFALEDHGVPDYYELVVISGDGFIAKNSATLGALRRALQAAIDESRRNPERALALYFKANPEVRKELDRRAFTMILPHFATTQVQSAKKWADFLRFSTQEKLIDKSLDAGELFVN